MNWWSSMFGEPHDPGEDDCDQCQAAKIADPDWYRMGLKAPRKRATDLSQRDPRAFLDRLAHYREQYGTADDDKGTGQSIDSFLKEKAVEKKPAVYSGGSLLGYATDFTLKFDPGAWTWASGGNAEKDDDDE